jgi:hypothetical protein
VDPELDTLQGTKAGGAEPTPFGRKVDDAVASGKFGRTLAQKAECVEDVADDKASQRDQEPI